MGRRGLVACLAAAALALPAAGGAAPAQSKRGAADPGRAVYLVSVGGSPSDVSSVARHFRRRLHLTIRVLRPLAVPPSAYDEGRQQASADALVDHLRQSFGRIAGDPRQALIGITSSDMYSRTLSAAALFGLSRGTVGIVSTARLDPASIIDGFPHDAVLRRGRLRKIVYRYIGALYYRQPRNGELRSALYEPVESLRDVDYMEERLRPAHFSKRKRAWLRGVAAACTRAAFQTDRITMTAPQGTVEEVLRANEAAVAAQDALAVRIRRVRADRAEAVRARRLVSRLVEWGRSDREYISALRSAWSDPTAIEWSIRTRGYAVILQSLALDLGSRTCSRFFDPLNHSTYRAAVGASRPTSFWRLGDSNKLADDELGTAPGIVYGPRWPDRFQPSLVPGDFDFATRFNGGNGFGMGEHYAFRGRRPFSVELLFRPSSVDGTYRRLVSKEDGQSGWNLNWQSAAGLRVERSSKGQRDATAAYQLQLGQTHHVAAVYDGTELRLYVDGSLVRSRTSTRRAPKTRMPFRVGIASYGADGVVGWLDDVAVWTRPLSSTDVALHARVAAGASPFPRMPAVPRAATAG